MTALTEAARLIGGAARFVLVTHVDPDPDAIGSTLGLAHGLLALDKRVILVNDDSVPPNVQFLPGSALFHKSVPAEFKPDVIIGLDASDPERLGEAIVPYLDGSIPVLNIDHHITNLNFGSVNYVMPQAASTAEMLPPLLDALGVEIALDIATCLLAGLVGDTRGLSTPSVTPATLHVAARLVTAGADLAVITETIMRQRDVDSLRLWGLALSGLQLTDGVIWTVLSNEARAEKGLRGVGGRGLSNLLLTADEAHVSAVFTEQDNGKVKVSMRAQPGYNVADVALSLGGGGHALAAGCTIDGPPDEAADRVVKRLLEQAKVAASEEGATA